MCSHNCVFASDVYQTNTLKQSHVRRGALLYEIFKRGAQYLTEIMTFEQVLSAQHPTSIPVRYMVLYEVIRTCVGRITPHEPVVSHWKSSSEENILPKEERSVTPR